MWDKVRVCLRPDGYIFTSNILPISSMAADVAATARIFMNFMAFSLNSFVKIKKNPIPASPPMVLEIKSVMSAAPMARIN